MYLRFAQAGLSSPFRHTKKRVIPCGITRFCTNVFTGSLKKYAVRIISGVVLVSISSTSVPDASEIERDSPTAYKTVHRTVLYLRFAQAGLSSPLRHTKKRGIPLWDNPFFGTPEGTRTPNPRNRNPMLYPLSHWRISDSLSIIAGFSGFVKRKDGKIFPLPREKPGQRGGARLGRDYSFGKSSRSRST